MEQFSYFAKGAYQKTPTKNISLQECARLVTSDVLKSTTEDYRKENDPDKKGEKKKKLPLVTFSGVFNHRAIEGLDKRSEYFCIDLDHVGDLTEISRTEKRLSDIFTPSFSFISPSGDGLKVIFKIDPVAGDHKEYVKAITTFVKSETGKIDESCKDVSRGCFLCHDPFAVIYDKPITLGSDFLKKYSIPEGQDMPLVHTVKNGYYDPIYNEILATLKLPFSNGNRNNFIMELAGSCHRRAVPESYCLNRCLEYQEPGFEEKEIQGIIKSIYCNHSFDSLAPVMADLEKQLAVDLNKQPEAAPAILFYKEIPFACLQDFTLITGKAKVKKTFLTVLLVASYLGYRNELIKAEMKGTVLWFDTEQSPHYFFKTLKRVCRMTEHPPRLKGYNLKTLTPLQKTEFIEYVIKTTPDVQLVVIDGIRDLVFDINSPEEATKTSVRLMKWAAESNIHLIVILHQNKADGNARGHLGTELVNKAQTVLSVSLDNCDKKVSTVEPEFTRDLSFPGFSFTVNDNSLPELCDTPEKEIEGKKIPTPNQLSDETHYRVLRDVYKRLVEYPTYTELLDQVIEGFNFSFGQSKCRMYLSYYLTQGWITKMREGHKMIYKYEKVVN